MQNYKVYIKLIISILCLFTLSKTSIAKEADFVKGELIVKLFEGKKVERVVQDFAVFEHKKTFLRPKKKLSQSLNIWLLEFDAKHITQQKLQDAIFHHKAVAVCQNNHFIEKRNTPNDTQYTQQWQFNNTTQSGGTLNADLDAPEAWDIATGGLTALGDTIVVAIIDDGIDLEHDDFAGNLWRNHAEIPDNDIDDDGNGYVDDYLGWNTFEQNGNVDWDSFHGTPVAGIVGARGNNNVGVSGVNWVVKLMIVVGGSGTEANALESYSYVLEMRQKYNASGGNEGAFVVATNSSWGANFAQAEDMPLWCAFYDEMGEAGIVSAAGTMNGNQNVDEVGDMPSTCSSDFLITVTNMNDDDEKVTSAAYGLETIDVGAFGDDVWTMANNNSYGAFGGTSGASPHVAGIIGLLYSVECPALAQLAREQPAAAATLARNAVLNGVDENASLNGITTTGGRVNMHNTLQLVEQLDCVANDCFAPHSLFVDNVSDTQATLHWTGENNVVSFSLFWRVADGDITTWNNETVIGNNFEIESLEPCTNYEFFVAANCSAGESSPSFTYSFSSEGCCVPPVLSLDAVGETTASVSWTSIFAAAEYQLDITNIGTNETETLYIIGNSFDFEDLAECGSYEIKIGSNCTNGELSEWSPTISFATVGCGNCVGISYCSAMANDASTEWIAYVGLGSIDNSSETDGGYADYSQFFTILKRGESYELNLAAGYLGLQFSEYFKVWIDYNQDGLFDDNTEVLFDAGETTTEPITSNVTIANDALLGNTLMRVAMKYNAAAEPCESFSYGEIEDYCVKIDAGVGLENAINVFENLKIYPNPFAENLIFEVENKNNGGGKNVSISEIDILDVQGKVICNAKSSSAETKIITDVSHLETGVYMAVIRFENGEMRYEKLLKY